MANTLWQLKLQLDRNHDKLTDLFETMSADDTTISRYDFHRAITHELRLDASSSTVDALFTHADTHGDGAVDFRTLGKALSTISPLHYDFGYTSPSPDTSDRRHSSLLSTVSSTQTESGTIPKTEVSTQTDTFGHELEQQAGDRAEWEARAIAAERRASAAEQSLMSIKGALAEAEESAARAKQTTMVAEEELARIVSRQS